MKVNKVQKGFSLIELMVSVSIFAIVMLIGTGAILAIVNGNKKNQGMQVAISNLNYAVENMTRNMKTGRNFNLVGGNNDSISFTTTDNEDVIYSLDQNDPNHGRLMLKEGTSDPIAVTAPEIDIDDLKFTTIGTGSNDGLQPAVIILINGTAKNVKGDLQTSFSIHTSVTQRAVDF